MHSLTLRIGAGRILVSVPGVRGFAGWTPLLSVASDGNRRVHRIADYVGGSGPKPPIGLYVGSTGLVANIADAVDIGASATAFAPVTSVAGRTGAIVLTKDDVGLESVDNTPDAAKPVSSAQAAADAAVAASAAADATTKANAAQAAAIAAAAAAAPALAPVQSVAGRTGNVSLTTADVGLGNVDNTADASKPVSTAQSAADAAVALAAASALAAHEAASDPHPGYTTSAELSAGLSSKADASHTHAASALTQSGASTGQMLQWNGSQWVPVTFTAGVGGGTGSTDNALIRADGTGGSTLQGSGVTLDDSANLSATNWVIGSGVYSGRTYARVGGNGANVSLILSPTGTGYISAQIPDGLFGSGNQRGNSAVDFQVSRTIPQMVASGEYSAILGGSQNTASGPYSFCAGIGNAVSGNSSGALGYYNTVSGNFSYLFGAGGSITSGFSFGTGYYPRADKEGQSAHASGIFAAIGDAQCSRMVARAATTNATPTALGLGLYATGLISVPANSSGRARITVVARRATAGAESMTWTREVAWQRGVAASTTTVDVQTVGTDRGHTGGAWGSGPAWSIAITADTTNGALAITVTGAAATNIRWAATIDWTEVTYG